MDVFVFDEAFVLGIAEIDEQHARFISYINDAWDALEQGKNQDEFLYILNRLLDYAMDNFTCEEALMRKYHYPSYEAHKQSHNETAAELFDFDRRLLTGDSEESRAFVEFLTRWLKNHILETDRELGAFLKQQGIS